MKTVSELQKCPELVQTDCGTENGILAAVQCTLRNDIMGHRYGSSPSNQRIENWWSHCKRGYSAWVIDYFKSLVAHGILILGSHFHMECAWFVYSEFLQREMDTVKDEWNSHYIRKSRHSAVGGIPDELFFLPEAQEYSDCGYEVTENDISCILAQRDIYAEAAESLDRDDRELIRYFKYVIHNEGLQHPPRDWGEAKAVFRKIIEVADC